ncbi:hypothetical protein FA95DRAFT_1560484 [Auriscalpium vulgare]|uniref:Uncharacterized protein n=1 Tax=Auriscalpium vulgare TaxID=40419 RepID=A0ACB8RPL7_9AGAM|nr:hypothetical protein FA95DRAFT_1560484 [Auriscalpium vulgare]
MGRTQKDPAPPQSIIPFDMDFDLRRDAPPPTTPYHPLFDTLRARRVSIRSDISQREDRYVLWTMSRLIHNLHTSHVLQSSHVPLNLEELEIHALGFALPDDLFRKEVAPHLRILKLSHTRFSARRSSLFQNPCALTVLEIRNATFWKDFSDMIAILEWLPNLRTLVLDGAEFEEAETAPELPSPKHEPVELRYLEVLTLIGNSPDARLDIAKTLLHLKIPPTVALHVGYPVKPSDDLAECAAQRIDARAHLRRAPGYRDFTFRHLSIEPYRSASGVISPGCVLTASKPALLEDDREWWTAQGKDSETPLTKSGAPLPPHFTGTFPFLIDPNGDDLQELRLIPSLSHIVPRLGDVSHLCVSHPAFGNPTEWSWLPGDMEMSVEVIEAHGVAAYGAVEALIVGQLFPCLHTLVLSEVDFSGRLVHCGMRFLPALYRLLRTRAEMGLAGDVPIMELDVRPDCIDVTEETIRRLEDALSVNTECYVTSAFKDLTDESDDSDADAMSVG